MRVDEIRLSASPRTAGALRLSARMTCETPSPTSETVWLDVLGVSPDEISTRGDPWLALALPLAAHLGEALTVDAPTSPRLVAGARRVLETWHRWFGLPRVDLHGPTSTSGAESRRVGAFFSGGIDSFCTALHPGDPLDPTDDRRVDDLVFIAGFDLPLSNEGALAAATRSVEEIAATLGRGLVRTATNVRDTRWSEPDWADRSHGGALAFVAHALAGRFERVRVPSSVFLAVREVVTWGSHRDVDPHLASESLRLVYDRDEVDRFAKIAAVAHEPLVQRHVRVCFKSGRAENCGRCRKCVLTMAVLEACAGPSARRAFPDDGRLLRRLAAIDDAKRWERRTLVDLRDHAERSGRSDIARAAARAVAASDRWERWAPTVARWKSRPLTRPFGRALKALVRWGAFR